MKCPYCSSKKHHVLDSRDTPDHLAVRRRRACMSCEKRFTTYERIESVDITVIKKDLTKVPFDKQKVLNGVMRACEKRPVSLDVQRKIADQIESTIRSSDSLELTSREIGELVMKLLKRVDKVAYIRFASVYKEFQDVEEFEEELKKLGKK